jgi:SulP family sulfate permease
MKLNSFEPKLVTVLKEGYSWPIFFKDLTAGVIVGIVALPLSIAFAIASGAKPEQGLITAVIAGFLISALSGSRVQIGGPTGAFIVIVYDIVQKHGYEGLAIATFMAGFALIFLGITRMGEVIKFIPYPVTLGFTSGIALIIFTSQVRDFLGLSLEKMPEHFIDKWSVYITHFTSLNSSAFFIGIITLLIIIFWPKVTKRIPGTLVALIVTTFFVHYFNLSVETIGSRFGEVPNSFPKPHLPITSINLDTLVKLSPAAMTIALLAGIESLLSAVVADGMTGRRHRSNIELIAQGVANVVAPIFGGIPATGAIARTATNIKNGGLTPVSGIIHAITVLLIFLFFGKLAALIPMATLSGILIFVAYSMSEWHLFGKVLKSSPGDSVVLILTFLLTVLVDLTVAIEVGVVLASFLFMKRMLDVTQLGYITDETDDPNDPFAISKQKIPKGVEVFEIHGPFFFAAADKFRDTIREIQRPPKILILRLRYVPTIDTTGLRALEDLYERARREKTILILSGVTPTLYKILTNGDFIQKVGKENVLERIDYALNRAREILEKQTAS